MENQNASGAAPRPETADIETSNDAYAERFKGASGAWMLAVQERGVLRLLRGRVQKGATVLDVGGGHGQLARPLAREGFRVTVIGSAASCERRIADLTASGAVKFTAGDVMALPFPDKSFDAVAAVRMLTHCGRWEALAAEMCRVSRGPVITDYPTSQSLNAAAPALFNAKKKYEKNTRPWRLFRHAEVRGAFAAAGFAQSGRFAQFFLPMVVHRALRQKAVSAAAEGLFRALGLTALFGSPVIVRMERRAPRANTSTSQT